MRPLLGSCSILIASLLGCSGGCRGGEPARPPRAPGDGQATLGAAPISNDATAVAAPPAGPPVATLTEDLALPYFADGAGQAAAARFALEDWAAAADGFTAVEQALPLTDVAGRGHAALLAGLAESERGRWSAAADDLARAHVALPALADWIGYQEARARFFAHDPITALSLAKAVRPDSIAGTDAAL